MPSKSRSPRPLSSQLAPEFQLVADKSVSTPELESTQVNIAEESNTVLSLTIGVSYLAYLSLDLAKPELAFASVC